MLDDMKDPCDGCVPEGYCNYETQKLCCKFCEYICRIEGREPNCDECV